jgi:hypothetical protein
MEILGHLLFALLSLGLAALPFLLVLCLLRFLGTVIGRGMAAGMQQAQAPRSQGERLFWLLFWLAAGGLVVLALVSG